MGLLHSFFFLKLDLPLGKNQLREQMRPRSSVHVCAPLFQDLVNMQRPGGGGGDDGGGGGDDGDDGGGDDDGGGGNEAEVQVKATVHFHHHQESGLEMKDAPA